MKKKCFLCEKEFVNFLEHISIKHDISTIEDYELKVKEKENKKIKIQAFLEYVNKDLMEKFRRGEISPEKLRELSAKWEKDNNLIW